MVKFTDEEFLILYDEFRNSNYSVVDFCNLKGIGKSTFYKKMARINHKEKFIDITDKLTVHSELRLNLKTIDIIIDKNSDLDLLKEVIRKLS